MHRTRITVIAGVVVLVLAVALAVYLTGKSPTSGGPPSGSPSGRPPAGNPTTPSKTPPHGSFVVTSYGADPTGQHDSTVAIRKAMTAAEASAGNTVYFPAGTYTLDDNDGAKIDFLLQGPNPIVVEGAGRETTKLVEKVGLGAYPNVAHTKTVFQITSPGGDGTTITGLTVDSQTYSAGTTLIDYANNTTISHGTFLGARSNHNYNRDVFVVRVIAVCNHTNGIHHSNNTVDDLILNGQGSAGNVDLDISCQWDTRVSNITDTGNGMALYIDRRVTVNGFNYTPGKVEKDPKSYFITGPSDHISLSNIVTSGNGGFFQSSPNNYRITDTTITGEKMTQPGTDLVINDADNTSITNSVLVSIVIQPSFSTHGLDITSSTVGSIQLKPKPGATVTSLIVTSSKVGGVLCPPNSGAKITSLIGLQCG
jgi:hypothetical protein